MKGRRQLLELVDLLEAGCESELEIWGYREVFDHAALREAKRQRPLVASGRTYRVDLAFEDAKLAVELDGRAFHASTAQWERDIKRDLALATIGWQTIRLSHQRLTSDPAGCRRDVLRVLAARRPPWTLAADLRDTPARPQVVAQ
jgi:very-short-patch-repair endonuclease